MRSRILDKVFELSGFDVIHNKESINSTTINFLNKYRVPGELSQLFIEYSFNQPVKIRHVYFDKVNELEEHNSDEMNHKCIEAGLIIIGSGLNGDPIVVDLKSLHVGFVFHDELWEDEEIADVREMLVNMNCKIEEFYLNALQVENYPVDAYQAEEYMNCF